MYQIAHNKLYLAGAVVLVILLLGVGWFVRMDSGLRWPLYLIILLAAPVVPWLLQLAYKAAAPVDNPAETPPNSSPNNSITPPKHQDKA